MWIVAKYLGQCWPFDQMHGHKDQVIVGVEVEDTYDIRMAQRSDGLSFQAEARNRCLRLDHVRMQHFDRHITVQVRVERPVYFGHAPTPDDVSDLVFA